MNWTQLIYEQSLSFYNIEIELFVNLNKFNNNFFILFFMLYKQCIKVILASYNVNIIL